MVNKLRQWVQRRGLDIGVYLTKKSIDIESGVVSSFFDCPRLSFDLEINPSPAEGERIDYAAPGGLMTIFCPKTASGAHFSPDGERNVITITSLSSKEHLTEMLRHEVVHGYHFRNNESLQSAMSQTGNYFSALESILRSSGSNELSPQAKEILVSGYHGLIKQTIASEAIARGYVDSRNNKGVTSSDSIALLSFDSKAKVSEEFIKTFLTNYDLDSGALNLKTEEVIPFLRGEYTKAYSIFRIFGDQALFIDDSSDLPPIITSRKEESRPSGTEVLICPQYKPLSPGQVEQRLREWFAMDYVALADSLIDKNARHYHRVREAFKEYQGEMERQ